MAHSESVSFVGLGALRKAGKKEKKKYRHAVELKWKKKEKKNSDRHAVELKKVSRLYNTDGSKNIMMYKTGWYNLCSHNNYAGGK